MKRILNTQDGYIVLITVLILGTILTTIATFLLLTGQNASISTNSVNGGAVTKAAANGCANLALGVIQNNPTIATPASGSATLDSTIPETCSYTISGSTPAYTINATGTVTQGTNNYVHKVTITITAVNPQITISSWLDSQ